MTQHYNTMLPPEPVDPDAYLGHYNEPEDGESCFDFEEELIERRTAHLYDY